MPNEKLSTPRRLKMVIAYDGGCYDGWQSQVSGNTIQDFLEGALEKVSGTKIRVHGAGRTDAGVHALGQCAHADLPPTRLAADTWMNALNSALPPQIRVWRCQFVRPTFHARFSARGKIYRYRIATTTVLSPLEVGRAWHVRPPLDRVALRECAALFVGEHDFAGFAAQRGAPPESTVRTIRTVTIRQSGATVTLNFDGDGFLYKMVRLMVGAIILCAKGKATVATVRGALEKPKTSRTRLVAPAAGLTLVRVRY